jgi:hypothetical protein
MPRDIPMKKKEPTKALKALYDRTAQTMADTCKEFPEITAEQCLAIMAQMVGKCIAFQDQRKYTTDLIMAIVETNIEAGNQQAVDELMYKQEGGKQ